MFLEFEFCDWILYLGFVFLLVAFLNCMNFVFKFFVVLCFLIMILKFVVGLCI